MSYENILKPNWTEKQSLTAITQQFLTNQGFDLGKPDGLFGIKSKAALVKWKQNTNLFGMFTEDRTIIAIAQTVFKDAGCTMRADDIDGYIGPGTRWAFEEWKRKISGQPADTWRDKIVVPPAPKVQAPAISTQFPKDGNESEIIKYYGQLGSNQTTITLPYSMRIAWNTNQVVSKMGCHEKVADLFLKGFQKVEDAYGLVKISQLGLDLYGGCLSVRQKRGGTSWSTHAWGAAIDIDPDRNQLKWKKEQATLSKPEYDEWWRIWEDLGAVSLGRKLNYDWMHFQFIRIY